MVNTFSPILISVYNRLEHFERCIESLKKNELCSNSDLFIVSDSAKNINDELKVKEIRDYISRIDGFLSVNPIIQDKNLGGHLSIFGAINQILPKFGKLIFLEDDNIVSTNFLNFLNDSLDFYQYDTSLFSISAYNYPIQIPKSYSFDIYKWQGFSAWGVGLWWDRWSKVDWNLIKFKNNHIHKVERRKMDRVAEHLYWQLSYDITHNKITLDSAISYYMIKNNLYTIFPTISKVKNIGHDGSGEHCGIDDKFCQQSIDSGERYLLSQFIQPDQKINQILRKNFQTPIRNKIIKGISVFLPQKLKTFLKKFLNFLKINYEIRK